MPLYRSPLRPYDPVLEEPGKRRFKYIQSNFYAAGQDSFTKPFAQSQELFQALTNVMPVTEGIFRLRHGYQLFNNPGIGTIIRMYPYQNLLSGDRRLIYISGTTVDASLEDGTSLTSILTSANISNPRMVNSRDYGFFPSVITPFTWPSGQKSDGKKWNSVGGLTDWGLAQPPTPVNVTSTSSAGNVTLSSTIGRVYAGAFLNSTTGHYSDFNVGVGSLAINTVGPNAPGTVTQTSTGAVSWTNPTNVEVNDNADATAGLSVVNLNSETLLITNFGFSIPGSGTILGIQVAIKKHGTANPSALTDNTVQLIKGGTQSGNNKANIFDWTSAYSTPTYGGSNDLWGLTLAASDVNASNFGVAIQVGQINNGGGGATAGIDFVSITITYATGGGANTGAISSKEIALSLPTNNPPAGVDKFAILATLDGGDVTTFYVLDTVPIATSTYTDNIPDNVLATKNRATEVDLTGTNHGLIQNQMPPVALKFPTKHRGRIYGAVGENLFFSKSLDEVTTSTGLVLGRYEEAWPIANFLNVSTVKETIAGLLSDGNTLYIGTERKLWRLDGDGPQNFSKPEIIFNEVGLVNQDVWQVCFAEGQPVGMIWLTPDNRVIMSNFASYQDIGTPIQDVLSTINTSATNGPWGQFFSRQEFDIYVLAIPTGANSAPDTMCVYDLRGGRWYIWKLVDKTSIGLFNITATGAIQWLIAATSGKVYQFLPSLTQDRVSDTPVAITATITTPWLHFGKPAERKTFNELELTTSDANLLVTISGASIQSQTTAPNTVVSNAALTLSQFGYFKVYLASTKALDKFYQLSFTSSSGVQNILSSWTAELLPFRGF